VTQPDEPIPYARIAEALQKLELRLGLIGRQLESINELLTVAYVVDVGREITNDIRAALRDRPPQPPPA
jgi:hypothetical protein